VTTSRSRTILQPKTRTYTVLHGKPGNYARGCRCRTDDALFDAPQTTGCTEAWLAYKKKRRAAAKAEGRDPRRV